MFSILWVTRHDGCSDGLHLYLFYQVSIVYDVAKKLIKIILSINVSNFHSIKQIMIDRLEN